MKTTAATYSISVTTDKGIVTFYKTMPTKPKTHRGIKARNNKLEQWAMNEFPDFSRIEITLAN